MEIRGWFYFKLTESGNLIGEFSNNRINIIIPHTAQVIGDNNNFIGIFNNEWRQDNVDIDMTLTIRNEINNRVSLEWNEGINIIYRGLGTIVDGILIGNYENVQ